MVRVIAVASAKGGVGKTTTTVALGTTLAAAGHRVVAVDADLGMANLGTVLGIDADGVTIHDVLAGRADVSQATYEGPNGLSVVPGDTDLSAFPEADPAKLRTVLDGFDEADYLLVDTGAGLSHDTVLPLGLADEVLLVTDTDPNAVGDTEKTRQVVERLGGTVAGVVVTRVDGDDADGLTSLDALDAPVLATIPVAPRLTESTVAHSQFTPDTTSTVATAYRQLARELTGEEIPEPSVDEGPEATDENAAVETTELETETTPDADAPPVDDGEDAEHGDDDSTAADTTEDSAASTDSEDALVPEAEATGVSETTEATEETEAAEATEETDAPSDGVYSTSLVGEAERTEVADASAGSEADESEESEDADGEKRTGFLSRLLG
ncbi:nucleotide-binding protein [Halogranum rubrum]|uniref:CobQ/CobB/MinD/ParA nucleotide binding domain-containing protein n=1 Tax=Halogranum salarium B-1 TaxID=1210908 RepID=J2ZFX0_9EURY|nr:AAA family ATPase [Halogranum salarium]EJN59595.1 hypothetical protein HSB1_17530 [Halogranum salarium B-1]